MHKKLLGLGIILAFFVVLSGLAHALPITIEEVKVDGDVVQTGVTNILEVERGQDITVRVRLKGNAGAGTLDYVNLEAEIKGTDYKDIISDSIGSFKVMEGVSTSKELTLTIPSRLEQDRFKLRIRLEDRDGVTTQQDYEMQISAKRHQVTIKDIILSPENEVKAGRQLFVALRLKNTGQKDEEGVKVKLMIPELEVSQTDYVNQIDREDDENDQVTTNDILLRIPADAETGIYTLRAEVYFRDGDDFVSKDVKVRVLGEDKQQVVTPSTVKGEEKTMLFVPTETQSLTAGSETFYTLTISNSGSTSKSYTVSVDSMAWGTFRVTPSPVVVVSPGDSKTVNVYASAKADAPSGEQRFLVTIKTDNKILKQIPLSAVISGKTSDVNGVKLETVLKVLAVVLLAILVTIGLIFIFSRIMRKDDEGNGKAETEPYY